jgi:hypothetical protein
MDKTVGEMLGSLNTLHQREEEEEEEEEEISHGRKEGRNSFFQCAGRNSLGCSCSVLIIKVKLQFLSSIRDKTEDEGSGTNGANPQAQYGEMLSQSLMRLGFVRPARHSS